MAESYDYSTRRGIRAISWNDFHGLVKALVAAVAPWRPEIILPVLRGGAYPGMLMAHMLQVEVYSVRLSRRRDDVAVRESPVWLVEPPAAARGRRVLAVDEMCSTGETLRLVKARVQELGAGEVRTAALYAHTWGMASAEYIGLISDELVINPWDREIFRDGEFRFHPEYAAALAQQGEEPGPDLLVPATPFIAGKAAGHSKSGQEWPGHQENKDEY